MATLQRWLPPFLADQLSLFQWGEQIMPTATTLLPTPPYFWTMQRLCFVHTFKNQLFFGLRNENRKEKYTIYYYSVNLKRISVSLILNPWCHNCYCNVTFIKMIWIFPPILPPKHLRSAPVRRVPAQFQFSGRASRLVFVLILPSQKFFQNSKVKTFREQKIRQNVVPRRLPRK